MRIGMAFLIYVGIFVGLLLVVIVLRAARKDGSINIKRKYDERQDVLRGKGFKYAFFTLYVYNLAYGLLTLLMEKPFVDGMTAMMIGVVLATLVYVEYCIWKDAYVALNENRRSLLVTFAVVALSTGVGGVSQLKSGEMILDGVLNFRSLSLVTTVMIGIIFVTLLFKKTHDEE